MYFLLTFKTYNLIPIIIHSLANHWVLSKSVKLVHVIGLNIMSTWYKIVKEYQRTIFNFIELPRKLLLLERIKQMV